VREPASWVEDDDPDADAQAMSTDVAPRTPLRRNRDFMLLWTGQAVSLLGSRITSIAIPLLVYELTRSPADMGVVAFFGTLPYIVVQLPAGGIVDLVDRKRLMIACDAVRAIALGSIPVAIWLGVAGVTQLAVVAFVEGSLSVVFGLAENAALPKVVPASQLTEAVAQNEARERGAALGGQPLGTILYYVAHALPFVVDAISYAVSVVTLLMIKAPFRIEGRTGRQSFVREVREGVRWLWHAPFLRATSIMIAASNFIFQAVFLAVVVLARRRGASGVEMATIFLLQALGGLAGAVVAPRLRRRLPTRLILVGVAWFWAAVLPLMALSVPPIVLGPLFGAMTFVGPVWNVVIGTYQLTMIPDRLLGRVQSVDMLISWGAIPLGSLVAGLMLQHLSGGRAMGGLAAMMLATAAVATLSPSIRRAPPFPGDQANPAAGEALAGGPAGGGPTEVASGAS
jgi:transmembrane secretion effector